MRAVFLSFVARAFKLEGKFAVDQLVRIRLTLVILDHGILALWCVRQLRLEETRVTLALFEFSMTPNYTHKQTPNALWLYQSIQSSALLLEMSSSSYEFLFRSLK